MISQTLQNKLSSLLFHWFIIKNTTSSTFNIYLKDFSGRFLTAKVKDKRAIVPVFRNIVEVRSVKQLLTYKEGLFTDTDGWTSELSLIQALNAWASTPRGYLRTFKVKGHQYYVGEGFLMDESWNVLMLATFEATEKVRRVGGVSQKYLFLERPTVYLNPALFYDKQYDAWKRLFTEGLPLFNREISKAQCNSIAHNLPEGSFKLKIAIEDPTGFIYKVPHPEQETPDEALTPAALLQYLPSLNNTRI